jgi:hypothetical protein
MENTRLHYIDYSIFRDREDHKISEGLSEFLALPPVIIQSSSMSKPLAPLSARLGSGCSGPGPVAFFTSSLNLDQMVI